MDFKIITNNPMVEKLYPEDSKLIGGGAGDVFVAVRDMIHRGASLLNHPLSGSIPPGACPYKSLMINDCSGSIDFKSLSLIEEALAALRIELVRTPEYGESTALDFQTVDLDLLNSAMLSVCPWRLINRS